MGNEKYKATVEYLYRQLPFFQRQGNAALKLDLTRTIDLLRALRNPHHDFRTVHIAGTNGKGSSAFAIAAILSQSGFKTGLYTSPHLKDFRERIRVDGKMIEADYVVDFVDAHRSLTESLKPSFFELTVGMAFKYFQESKVDISVVETGLGGRLDSTNVITPEVSLITRIAKDHAHILGDTLEKIASEKAGIIKSGVPVVIGQKQEEVLHVFKDTAAKKNSPINIRAFDYHLISHSKKAKEITYTYQVGENEVSFSTDNVATYFGYNIPGVLETINELRKAGFEISDQHIATGLKSTQSYGLMGRFQVLSDTPMTVADVSHNKDGLTALFSQVERIEHNQLYIIIGMVADKDVDEVLTVLPKTGHYFVTNADSPRSMPAHELANRMKGFKVEISKNVNEAVKNARERAQNDDLILITGSTFVVAELDEI